MQKSLFEEDDIFEEEGLNSKNVSNINQPSNEPSCCCCWRPKSELTPFVHDICISKKYRTDAPFNPCIEKINNEFFGKCSTEQEFKKAKEKLIQKYGETKAEYINNWYMLSHTVGSSWECGDCMSLNDYGFEERRLDNLHQLERCDCCGRKLGEIKPFIERDPVMSHFKGKLLARRYRPDAALTDEASEIMDEFFGSCIKYEEHQEALERLIQKYGEEEAIELWTFAFFLDGLFKPSWECRDCIILDTHQYFEKKIAQESDNGHDSPG